MLKATVESTAPAAEHDAMGAPPVGTLVTASAAQSEAVIAVVAKELAFDVKDTFRRLYPTTPGLKTSATCGATFLPNVIAPVEVITVFAVAAAMNGGS